MAHGNYESAHLQCICWTSCFDCSLLHCSLFDLVLPHMFQIWWVSVIISYILTFLLLMVYDGVLFHRGSNHSYLQNLAWVRKQCKSFFTYRHTGPTLIFLKWRVSDGLTSIFQVWKTKQEVKPFSTHCEDTLDKTRLFEHLFSTRPQSWNLRDMAVHQSVISGMGRISGVAGFLEAIKWTSPTFFLNKLKLYACWLRGHVCWLCPCYAHAMSLESPGVANDLVLGAALAAGVEISVPWRNCCRLPPWGRKCNL